MFRLQFIRTMVVICVAVCLLRSEPHPFSKPDTSADLSLPIAQALGGSHSSPFHRTEKEEANREAFRPSFARFLTADALAPSCIHNLALLHGEHSLFDVYPLSLCARALHARSGVALS